VGDADDLVAIVTLLLPSVVAAVIADLARLRALESDLISQDLLIGFVAELKKQRWMLRSRLGEQAA
jgi:hypothetical protein